MLLIKVDELLFGHVNKKKKQQAWITIGHDQWLTFDMSWQENIKRN